MGFSVTYADGERIDYDDSMCWEVEGGVLKIGAASGEWATFISPCHWSTIDVYPPKPA